MSSTEGRTEAHAQRCCCAEQPLPEEEEKLRALYLRNRTVFLLEQLKASGRRAVQTGPNSFEIHQGGVVIDELKLQDVECPLCDGIIRDSIRQVFGAPN